MPVNFCLVVKTQVHVQLTLLKIIFQTDFKD